MLVIFCFVCTWTLILVGCWSFWDACKEGIATLKRLHEVPCSNCEFFTGDYRLKCTVHPREALSEEAIGCFDYQPPQYSDSVRRSHLLEINIVTGFEERGDRLNSTSIGVGNQR